MPLLYISIWRKKMTNLCEYNQASGNFEQEIPSIIEVLVPNQRESLQHQSYVFHAISENNYNYICLASIDFPRRIAFGFLNSVKQEFLTEFDDQTRQSAVYFGLNQRFQSTLIQKMNQFNDPENDKVLKANKDIEDVRDIMHRNLEIALERSANLQIMENRAQDLKTNAQKLKKQGREMEQIQSKRNCRRWIYLGIVIVLFIAWLSSSIVCGFKYDDCPGGDDDDKKEKKREQEKKKFI